MSLGDKAKVVAAESSNSEMARHDHMTNSKLVWNQHYFHLNIVWIELIESSPQVWEILHAPVVYLDSPW